MEKDITQLLEKVCDKLGIATDKLMDAMKKQLLVDLYIEKFQLVASAMILPILWWFWKLLIPHCLPENPKGQYSFDRSWPAEVQVMVAILSLATLVVLFWCISCLINVLVMRAKLRLNPEGALYEKVFSLLK